MSFFHRDHVSTTDSGIHIEDNRADRPEFKRTYTAKLDNRCSIKLEIRTGYGDRYKSGELTQPDGRYVLFDPERVADKIIDPTLVPLVEDACREILTLDREYVASNPDRFTDEGGHIWVRQS